MKLFLLLTSVLIVISSEAFADVLDNAEGTWGTIVVDETGEVVTKDYICDGLPNYIEIDRDKNRFSSRRSDSEIAAANIIEIGENWLKIQYDNEERIMSNGELHVWTLFMTDGDTFHWVREDWIVDGRITNATSARHRCEPAMS